MTLSTVLENTSTVTIKETENLIMLLDEYNAKTTNQKISNGINLLIGSLTDHLNKIKYDT